MPVGVTLSPHEYLKCMNLQTTSGKHTSTTLTIFMYVHESVKVRGGWNAPPVEGEPSAQDVQMKLNVTVECKRGEGKRFYLVEIHSQRPRNPGNPGICNLTEFNKEFEAGVNDSGICGKLGVIDFAPP